MLTKQGLADGIRFAGERAAAAATHCRDWDHQLGHQWTTRDAFGHIAATSAGAQQVYALLDEGVLSSLGGEQIAAMNAQAIGAQAGKSKEDLIAQIREGQETSAAFVETLDDGDLQKVVRLGGYEMSKAEVIAQVWIHHQIAHAYEASARWPLT